MMKLQLKLLKMIRLSLPYQDKDQKLKLLGIRVSSCLDVKNPQIHGSS
jgi:hypothetical protein